MTSMTSSKRKRTDVEALDEGLHGRKKGVLAQEMTAVMEVVTNSTLLRLVTSYQSGIPLLFPALARKHSITPDNIKIARQEAMSKGGLAKPGRSFSIKIYPHQRPYLERLKRMNASYMEMAIQDNDLRVLQMVYDLHKQGISSEHPRFGFRKPMCVAATYGRKEMLEWLKGCEESAAWLTDEWLLDAAFKSCDFEIVKWVYESYSGEAACVLRWRALDEIATRGSLDLLQWTLVAFPDAQLTVDAMDGAATNGHLNVVEYLHSERSEGCSTAALDKAAANGHLSVVEFLHTHRQEGCTVHAMNEAATNGHLDVVMYLHENREEGCTTKAMDGAATNGHLDVVLFLHKSRTEGCTAEAMNGAIGHGHLDVVQFLHRERLYYGDVRDAIQVALAKNHVSVIRFVCEHYHQDMSAEWLQYAAADNLMAMIRVFEEFKIKCWTTDVMDHAAGVGCLEAVKYLHDHLEEGCTTKAMDEAASNGHLDVVRFLHENRSEGCTKRAMSGAAAKGAMDVLKYLREYRNEGCTSVGVERAIACGHFEVVKFLLECCEARCPANAVSLAARTGQWDMLNFMLQENPPVGFDEVLHEVVAGGHVAIFKRLWKIAKVYATDCIKTAAEHGHWYIVKFLLSQASTSRRYCFSDALDSASQYGDIDMVELLLSSKCRYSPSTAHGFVNAAGLGNLDLLSLLETARRVDCPWGVNDSEIDGGLFEETELNWRVVQLAMAATHGYLEIVKRFGNLYSDSNPLKQCAKSGDIDVVRFLIDKYGYLDSSTAVVNAIVNGNLSMLQYLRSPAIKMSMGYKIFGCGSTWSAVFVHVAREGSLDKVKFIYEHEPKEAEMFINEAVEAVADSENLDVLRYLHEKGAKKWSIHVMDQAAECGVLPVIRFLHAHRSEGCTVAAMDNAAARGHLDIVKFLHENRTEGCTTTAMDKAASNGHLHVVRYLHENRTEGCTTSAMDNAAMEGRLRVVKFLHEHRQEGCTQAAMDGAIINKYFPIVKYLHTHRTEGCSMDAFDEAIRNNDLDMVRYLHENRNEGFREKVLEEEIAHDPDDEGFVHHYLLPDEFKHKKEAFLKKVQYERLMKIGRFAVDSDEEDEEYDDDSDDSSDDSEYGSGEDDESRRDSEEGEDEEMRFRVHDGYSESEYEDEDDDDDYSDDSDPDDSSEESQDGESEDAPDAELRDASHDTGDGSDV